MNLQSYSQAKCEVLIPKSMAREKSNNEDISSLITIQLAFVNNQRAKLLRAYVKELQTYVIFL